MLGAAVTALALATAASCSSSDDAASVAGAASEGGATSGADATSPSSADGAVVDPTLDAAGARDTGPTGTSEGGADADSGPPPPCSGTSDCPSNTLCCAHLTLGPDRFPQCGIADEQFACEATCSTFIPGSCSLKLTARRCHSSADCTSSSNNLCCTITSLGGLDICANATAVAQYGGGVCH
jgi:hypothetical protein